MKNTEIVRLLYNNPTKTERTGTICNEVVKQKNSAGYTNLKNHLEGHHAGFQAVAEECLKRNCQPISSMFVHKDAADIYGWAKLVALKTFLSRMWMTLSSAPPLATKQ
ncbi:hypothetical protein L914_11656 [Phytophthora nicotianae]|uniref:BED-type domain-containing protein n=2 Tax=Phytophthora nicotianae TaxID=4792 RepID=V9EU56_PHYNI|nr:hypothetical protein F443_12116 [Phytophthora nicotianae P1569]ETM42750.1 hypothetical protein L914_11656 [Phytophthora nicotianae]